MGKSGQNSGHDFFANITLEFLKNSSNSGNTRNFKIKKLVYFANDQIYNRESANACTLIC
jgi:hypothetical protein